MLLLSTVSSLSTSPLSFSSPVLSLLLYQQYCQSKAILVGLLVCVPPLFQHLSQYMTICKEDLIFKASPFLLLFSICHVFQILFSNILNTSFMLSDAQACCVLIYHIRHVKLFILSLILYMFIMDYCMNRFKTSSIFYSLSSL